MIKRARIMLFIFMFILTSHPFIVLAQTGLPWFSDFEKNNFNEWNAGTRGDLTVSTQNPLEGSYCAKAQLIQGTNSDNYADHLFGDHYRIGMDKVEEIYLQFYSKFNAGYVWPDKGHKLAILNLTDGVVSNRRYQVYIRVNPSGQYAVDHSYIDSWTFFGLSQNQGSPAPVIFDVWEKLKLYVKLNTPGSSDGIVKLWINNVLKLSYSNLNIRENTSYGINKLILSSWSTRASGSDGVQWYDDWKLSATDIVDVDVDVVLPVPPTGLNHSD